jgi:hypothetical protein
MVGLKKKYPQNPFPISNQLRFSVLWAEREINELAQRLWEHQP